MKDFTKFSDPSSGSKFFHKIANSILDEHNLIYCAEEYYEYIHGVYSLRYEMEIKQWIIKAIGDKYKQHTANEILAVIKPKVFKRPEELNAYDSLNFKNGMLDLSKSEESLVPHDSKYLSTMQLDIDYIKDACPMLWDKTLKEILHWEDVLTLQEFFGLCLTRDTTFQKALFLLGEGANGKGVVTHILEQLVGLKNRSVVSIDKLNDDRLVSCLYGKLVNISTETAIKGYIHDSTFKTVVVGESIQANPKYRMPFEFIPFCKMIVSTNDMPRTNDTSYAFHRRMIIIPFDQRFEGEIDNKQLRFQLEKELSGILLWAIYGLKRLRKNKQFSISTKSKELKEEYKRENNTILMFVDECCSIDKTYRCETSGKGNFGKELLRQFKKQIYRKKIGANRGWQGINVGQF